MSLSKSPKKNISKKKTKKVRVKSVPCSVVHQAFIEDLLHAEHGAAHHSLSGDMVVPQINWYNALQVMSTYKQMATKTQVGEAISSNCRYVCTGGDKGLYRGHGFWDWLFWWVRFHQIE